MARLRRFWTVTWVRADQLRKGQKTCGGLAVDDIQRKGDLFYVIWRRAKVSYEVYYTPDQEFDMAPDGAEQDGEEVAQRVEIKNISDLSGEEGANTVEFSLDGVNYEIDLTPDEESVFRNSVAQYVGVGRRTGGRRRSLRSVGGGAQSNGPSPKVIREWAKDNGYDVPDRGRIPEEVREAYKAASDKKK